MPEVELLHHVRMIWHFCIPYICSPQQEHVFTELKEYAASTPTPLDATAVAMVVKYLEACNRLFERGILGHVYISTYPNHILNNMEEGYSFYQSVVGLTIGEW